MRFPVRLPIRGRPRVGARRSRASYRGISRARRRRLRPPNSLRRSTWLLSRCIPDTWSYSSVLSLLLSRRLRRSFGVLLHALVDRSPTGAHALAVVVDDQSKRGVVKLDQRAALFL